MSSPGEKIFRFYPFVPLAGAWSLGICFGRFGNVPLEGSAILSGLTLALLLTRCFRALWLTLFCLGAGMFVYDFRFEILSETDVRLLAGDKERLATVRGKLLETPVVRETQYGEKIQFSSSGRIKVSEIKLGEIWQPASGTIASSTREQIGSEFFAGQEIEVFGVLQMPARAAAPGLFDYRKYLYNQRIFYALRAESKNDWKIISSPATPPLAERFRRWAKWQLGRGVPEDEALRLIWAMTLGWQSSLSGEVAEPFMRTGTMHIFAISGLHVVCLAGIFLFSARICGLPRHRYGLMILPLLWFYILATGWQSSAIRSGLMSSIIIIGWALKRPAALLNSTAAAALLILAAQPEQLFQTGFQLSFAVVISMALFIPILEAVRAQLTAPDPFIAPGLQSRLRIVLEKPFRFITVNFVVSLAAWLGSLPIVAWYFNIVTPVSLFANLVAVPLSSAALGCNVVSLVVPFLGPIFNYLGWAFMWATIFCTKSFATFPAGYFYVPKPDGWFFLFYFALVSSIITGGLWKKERRAWVIPLIAVLGIIWLVALFAKRDSARVTILPAAGTPVFADFPGKANDLLIDCSTENGADYLVKRFLRAQGVGSVRNMLITHGDINHAEGFFTLEPEFSPSRIFTTPARARSPTYKRVIKSLESLPGKWEKVARGQWIDQWKVLHPGGDVSFARADDNAIVLFTEIEGWQVLFLSELGSRGQEDLLRNEPKLKADIVISGLPEQSEPLKTELLEQLKPQVIILGTSRFHSGSRNFELVRDRLRKSGPRLFLTGEQGAITLRFRKQKAYIKCGGDAAEQEITRS